MRSATWPGVATPMVSPTLSSWAPMATSRSATSTTWPTETGPSQGSPKHMDT